MFENCVVLDDIEGDGPPGDADQDDNDDAGDHEDANAMTTIMKMTASRATDPGAKPLRGTLQLELGGGTCSTFGWQDSF